MPLRIHHVDLPVDDPKLVEEFYKKVFGWLPRTKLFRTVNGWSDTWTDAPDSVILEYALNDGSYITFINTKSPEYSGDEPHIALLMTPQELEAVRSNLKRLGLDYEENGENLALYGPSNLRVELYTAPETGGAVQGSTPTKHS